ncbi:MAG: FkbM family methyltransferase [Desulfobaccales bacterium]
MNDLLNAFIPSGRLIEAVPSDQTLLGKFIHFPFRLIPRGLIIPILQGKLRGKRWVAGSSVSSCWLGSYEYDKQSIFAESIAEGSIVFDIGAHVGFYTLLSSVLVGPKGRVFAFEPIEGNLFYLKKHLHLNHITNVSVIEAAVSDHDGVTYFARGCHSSQGHISPKGNLLVKTVCLDELHFNRKVLTPDFIKIDVEGAEMSVLIGARSILEHYHPMIFLATHGEDVHRQCIILLKSLDYKIEAIDGKPITHSKEILACQ